ncbi:extracellular matrix protein 1-like [Mantella aurantiaca]
MGNAPIEDHLLFPVILAPSPRGEKTIFFLDDLDDFPPGKPSKANIGHICRTTRNIVTYGDDDLPQTGFSYLRRQERAINSMEEGYSRCCSQSEKLRCALEVWKNAMNSFCMDEFSVKTRPYNCCKKRDIERETCFSDEAPNPNYISSAPLLEIGSTDIPSVTGSPSLKTYSPHSPKWQDNPEGKYRLSDLAFPPGEPTTINMQYICKLRKYRPLYTDNVMPQSGFGHYVRWAKAIYCAESEFKKCCKTEDVACAHNGWRKALSQFCAKELEVKSKHYECCKKDDQASVFHCFASKAPFPMYDKEVEALNLGNITESILEKVCTESKLLTKQKRLPHLVSDLREFCCSLPQDEKLLCAQQQKEKFMNTLCGTEKDSWKDTQNCCSKDDLEREECFSFYLEYIFMAVSHRTKGE